MVGYGDHMSRERRTLNNVLFNPNMRRQLCVILDCQLLPVIYYYQHTLIRLHRFYLNAIISLISYRDRRSQRAKLINSNTAARWPHKDINTISTHQRVFILSNR